MSQERSAHVLPQPGSLPTHARIGPNAIIQTVQALKEFCGVPQAIAILQKGDQAHLIDRLPSAMIDEQEFHALVWALVEQLGPAQTQQILRRSGQLTALYLLQHRIPKPFQWLLKVLPRRVGLTLLLTAISKHAWTFAGSGQFSFTVGKVPRLTITRVVQSSEAISGFYAGTFEQLLQTLIDARSQVQEQDRPAGSGAAWTYIVTFRSRA